MQLFLFLKLSHFLEFYANLYMTLQQIIHSLKLHSSFLFYFQLHLVQITLQKVYAFLFNQILIHVIVPWNELCAPHRHRNLNPLVPVNVILF